MRSSICIGSRWFRSAMVAAVVAAPWSAVPARAGLRAPCPGDCNADRQVAVSEIVSGLRIALGLDPYATCPAADSDGDGTVHINEIIAGIRAALLGCPGEPTTTASANRSATATPTDTSGTPTATPTPSITATVTDTGTPTQTPTARATPPLSARVCGDGTIQPGEECDDHNGNDGDGCSALCRTETGEDPCAGVTPVSGTNVTAARVAAGLNKPLHATAPPRDFQRVFVVEQVGRIRIIKDGQLLAAPFLDISSRVSSGGERGLLSLAFHPQYAANGEFFVDYTTMRNTSLVSVVSRFRVSADPDRADPASEEIVLEQDQPYVAHNGGQLAFDAAGYLYISFGDGGVTASRQNNGQDPTTWLAKILRIDVDGGTPYALPAHNPFLGPDGVLDEIWVSGLRNPWRFSFDRLTGDAFIGDVGEGAREEVDVVPAGSGGANFGWCCREGTLPSARCFSAATTCPAEGLTAPVFEYDHSEGCSITGGFVYRGCALPELRGTYFYGDYCAGFVRSFVYLGGLASNEHDWTAEITPALGTINLITGFGEDARGELYICDQDGEVFKLVPSPLPPP